MSLYNDALGNEWIDWVEIPDPEGIREKEIFPFVKRWLEQVKPKILADIGCGQGSCSRLVDNKIKYIGVDPSSILISRAKKLYTSSNKKFMEGDAYDIPLENESVDAIISIWVWSHLDNLKLATKEMFRVLNSKGQFLIITANPGTYEERKTFYKNYTIKGNLLQGTFDLGNEKALTDTTLYLHTKEDMEKAIIQSELKINRITYIGQAESSNRGLYIVIEGSK